MESKLRIELEKGRISGPFDHPPFPNFHCSPMAIVPKKTPGEFRRIHNLSAPKGHAINEGIPQHVATVKYQKLDHAFDIISKYGKGTLLAKCDIEDAFRLIPMAPADYPLLGFTWQDKFYYDKVLPMGASSSCRLFEDFSSALHWIMESKFGSELVHIIDDFLFIGPPNSQKCSSSVKAFMYTMKDMGVPLKMEKTIWPTTCLDFMGITVDTGAMEARLPPDKIEKCINLIQNFLSRNKVTLKELQSLLGLLNFACRIVVPGRAFLRRLYNLTLGVKKPHHHIRLCTGSKDDLRVWLSFLEKYNGKSLILEKIWLSADLLHLYTDASSKGFGCILDAEWSFGEWPNSWANDHITVKETYPIVLAIALFGEKLQNKCIVLHCDNMAVVEILNKQSSKHMKIMSFVRQFVFLILKWNIMFRAQHVPGKQNILADLLSRLQVQEFRLRCPGAKALPLTIPKSLSPDNW